MHDTSDDTSFASTDGGELLILSYCVYHRSCTLSYTRKFTENMEYIFPLPHRFVTPSRRRRYVIKSGINFIVFVVLAKQVVVMGKCLLSTRFSFSFGICAYLSTSSAYKSIYGITFIELILYHTL